MAGIKNSFGKACLSLAFTTTGAKSGIAGLTRKRENLITMANGEVTSVN